MGPVVGFPGIADQPVAGRSDPEGKPGSGRRDELLQLDRRALGMRPEGLGLNPAAGQAGEELPDVLSQQHRASEPVGGKEACSARVDMSDPPFMIAPEKGVTHPVEDLGGVAGGRILP